MGKADGEADGVGKKRPDKRLVKDISALLGPHDFLRSRRTSYGTLFYV
jgi:hypothetical protein